MLDLGTLSTRIKVDNVDNAKKQLSELSTRIKELEKISNPSIEVQAELDDARKEFRDLEQSIKDCEETTSNSSSRMSTA